MTGQTVLRLKIRMKKRPQYSHTAHMSETLAATAVEVAVAASTSLPGLFAGLWG